MKQNQMLDISEATAFLKISEPPPLLVDLWEPDDERIFISEPAPVANLSEAWLVSTSGTLVSFISHCDHFSIFHDDHDDDDDDGATDISRLKQKMKN